MFTIEDINANSIVRKTLAKNDCRIISQPEVEFIAEQLAKVTVTVIAPIEKPIKLTTLEIPASLPGRRLSIPLWLAIFLADKHLVKQDLPIWFNTEYLGEVLASETDNAELSNVPFFFEQLFSHYQASLADGADKKELLKLFYRLMGLRKRKIRENYQLYSPLEPLPLSSVTLSEAQNIKATLGVISSDIDRVITENIN